MPAYAFLTVSLALPFLIISFEPRLFSSTWHSSSPKSLARLPGFLDLLENAASDR
jgi:hypothetical protein